MPIDTNLLRQALGSVPTSVCAITARTRPGSAVAMIVGSFCSISLDPPLVGFFPARSSETWNAMRDTQEFTVNVLDVTQHELCKALSAKGPKPYDTLLASDSAKGPIRLAEAVAWIDCTLHAIVEAGDHELVMGRVIELSATASGRPMIFHRGQFSSLHPSEAQFTVG
ncbi:flavin reductase family protein [Sphingobium sp.]|uniref:flavin reductase family protein n=1 Tax=Sphingobium sp. TaxID=1912891 RepID=UPI0028BDE3D1|nr:flavin reductase family protein [Sphingobium sp.]